MYVECSEHRLWVHLGEDALSPGERVATLAAIVGQRGSLFAVLDAARWPGLAAWLHAQVLPSASLFSGEQASNFARVAPYLLHIESAGPALDELAKRRWDVASGIFLRSEGSFQDVRRALRRFAYAADEQGKRMFFRYYDPRVLRVLLPTCDESQSDVLFGGGLIDTYLTEGEELNELWAFTPERRDHEALRIAARLIQPAPGRHPTATRTHEIDP